MANIFLELIPLPTPEERLNPTSVFDKYEEAVNNIEAKKATVDDGKLLELSLKLFENDASRHAWINSRASGMMTAISLAAALVTGVGFTTFKDANSLSAEAYWTIFATYIVTLTYLSVTAILCFQIQGAIIRVTPDPMDLAPPAPAEPSNYPRQLAVRILRYTIINYRISNRIVAKLWIAQKCFRNALLTLVVGGIVAASFMTRPTPSVSAGLKLAQMLGRMAGCADVPSLTMDRTGSWRGLCLFQGKTVNVSIDPEGRAHLQ